MIPYLIAAGVGFVVAKIFEDDDKKESTTEPTFHVFVRTEEFDKGNLKFFSFEDGKKFFDKIKSSKKIKYGDIVDYDDSEKELYNKWESEGNIGKEGYPKLSDTDDIQEATFSMFDSTGKEVVFDEFESK